MTLCFDKKPDSVIVCGLRNPKPYVTPMHPLRNPYKTPVESLYSPIIHSNTIRVNQAPQFPSTIRPGLGFRLGWGFRV